MAFVVVLLVATAKHATKHSWMTSGFVGSVGLVFDVTGAFFLAQSFIFKRRKVFLDELVSRFGYNEAALRGAGTQALQARVGFFFLGTGFFGQYLAYSGHYRSAVNPWPWQTFLIGSAAALLVVVVGQRAGKWYGGRTFTAFLAFAEDLNRAERERNEASPQ